MDDIVTRLRDQRDEDGYCVICGDGKWQSDFPKCTNCQAADEIERLRKRDAVLELFAKAFHVDEYGQFPVTNGEDVWAAVLAYAQMRVEETRRG